MRRWITTTVATVLAAGTVAVTSTAAQAATADELAAALLGGTDTLASAALLAPVQANGASAAVMTTPVAGFPTRAGGSYVVLSSGRADALIGAQGTAASTSWSSTAVRPSVYDVTTLRVTLDVPAGANCLLGVSFRFLSEEYPQYVGDVYNDAFIAEVGQSTWTIGPGNTIVAPDNFAFDPQGRVLSINSGLFGAGSSPAAEAVGTVFNGASPLLTAAVPLQGGTQQDLFFTVFDQSDATLDSAVIIDNLRVGTVADVATQCRPGAQQAPSEITVTAQAPTQVDADGTADDTYTVPAVEGVQYTVDGTPVAAGTYPGAGTVVVTATALPGYVLTGATEFTLVFTDVRHVTAVPPTQVDTWGTADDTYTIPSVDGVQYLVDGAPVAAGTHPGAGTVVVEASALPGYVLTGPTRFELVFTDVRQVAATEPTQVDTWGTADDTYTIPSVDGVQYLVDGSPVAPGTYPGTGTVVVTAEPVEGHVLTGPTEWVLAFTDVRQATAVAPGWTDAAGTADDTYTIPSVEGVRYSVDGTPVAAGTHPGTGTVVVEASALPGYVLTGPTAFTFAFTDVTPVAAVAPGVLDRPGTALDRVVVPTVPGVVYLLGDQVLAPGEHALTGTHEITVRAADERHVLTGPTRFTVVLSDADVPGQVTGLAGGAGREQVSLTWSPTPTATGYRVQRSTDGSTWTDVATTGAPAGTVPATGGAAWYRAAATNDLGQGPWSEPVQVAPARPAGAPRVTSVVPGNRSLTVTFEAPGSDGGAPVEHYEYTVDGGETWVRVDGSPFVVRRLTNGTTYDVRVRAVTAAGPGAVGTGAATAPAVVPVTVGSTDGTPTVPTVAPGAVLVRSDDRPVAATLTAGPEGVTVQGEGFAVALRGFETDGSPLAVDGEGRLVVEQGGFVAVTGHGFAPGSEVDVWLFSTPTLLGRVAVGADGTFSARLALPPGIPAGLHTAQLNGTAADGSLRSVATGLVVRAPADAPAAVGSGTAALAVTGGAPAPLGMLGLVLLGAGAGLVLAARRRTAQG
ncbi:hypothetical protein ATM99_00220 [Cellulomonas sp. B6]|nr:hypothetical protein ATM99_00220 [Cellulomonas sp. B6]